MTNKQEKAVEMLRREAKRSFFFGGEEKYEFKRFEVQEHELGYVTVAIETGLKDDEGTMAEVYAREYCYLFVGERGGVTWYKHNKNGKSVKRYFCEHSLLQAAIDHRI